MNGPTCLMIPQGSPKIHPRRVKLENRENSMNIERNNNSLFMILPFTRTPSRDARPCVFACVRETGGERVKLEPDHLRVAHVGACRARSGRWYDAATECPSPTGAKVGQMPASATSAARRGSSLALSLPDGDGNGRLPRFCLLRIANTPGSAWTRPPGPARTTPLTEITTWMSNW